MCRQCVADVMYGHEKNTPIDEEAWAAIEWPQWTADMERCAELIADLYSFPTCTVGGPLHIVTYDFSVEDGSLDFCENDLYRHWSVERAVSLDSQNIVSTATEIIRLMRGMTTEERMTVLARYWEHI